MRARVCLLSVLCACAITSAFAAPEPRQPDQEQLKLLSLEELMRIDVTTATRRAEPVGETAAAISVITGDDIRRSGVTTIADALLLADGVHVARFNNGTWAISSRGFNANTANKLLVMVDGRTVYSPLFTGVFWNTLDYILEDIDRIEVIRGPGATLWGANAVNGVVNIITRHTRDTLGTYASVSSGNEDPAITELRYGGTAGGAQTWRVYGKFAARDSQKFSTGGSSLDARRRGQAGFRLDGGAAGAATWLVKADAFQSSDDLADRADGEFTDLGLQARWSTPLANGSRLDVQSYVRHEYRRVPNQLTHRLDVVDVDAQHALTLAARHNVVWGGGARVNTDRTEATGTISFDPARRTYPMFSVFVQDEFAVVPERLSVTAGVKVEHNAFSGAETQPNVRARLLLPRGQVLWGAVSRAVRRPTRFDDDIQVASPGGVVLIRGADDFEAESLVAAELGYRVRPAAVVSADATLFVHRYADLRSQDLPAAGLLPLVVGNSLEGRSHGVELVLNVQPLTWWRTHLGYTWLDSSIVRPPGSRDVGGGATELNDPRHFAAARTSFDLPGNVELDAQLRAVASLPNPRVPAYAELNLRAGWMVTPRVEVSVTGHDLLHGQHPEFGSTVPRRVEYERSLRVGLALRLPR
jgi:iron complex outermembrane receptor protein